MVDQQPNMAVDTHVFRVSKRIGLVPQTASTPLAVEKELIKNIPEALIHKSHHWLILHGRYICVARNPKCMECGLRPACRYFQQVISRNRPEARTSGKEKKIKSVANDHDQFYSS